MRGNLKNHPILTQDYEIGFPSVLVSINQGSKFCDGSYHWMLHGGNGGKYSRLFCFN